VAVSHSRGEPVPLQPGEPGSYHNDQAVWITYVCAYLQVPRGPSRRAERVIYG
jgi:hypothetical protein